MARVDPAPDAERFTYTVLERLQLHKPALKVAVRGPLELAVAYEDGSSALLSLHNLWRELGATLDTRPVDLTAGIDAWVQAHTDPLRAAEPSALGPSLRVALRLAPPALPGAALCVREGVVPGLVAVLLADRGGEYQFVSEADLERAELDGDAAWRLAEENTWSEVEPLLEVHGEGTGMLTCGGNLEASLPLLPGVWERVAGRVQGDLVIAVAARDLVFFTGADDREGVERVRAMAVDAHERQLARLLSPELFRRDGAVWVGFEASPLAVSLGLHTLAQLRAEGLLGDAYVIPVDGTLFCVPRHQGMPLRTSEVEEPPWASHIADTVDDAIRKALSASERSSDADGLVCISGAEGQGALGLFALPLMARAAGLDLEQPVLAGVPTQDVLLLAPAWSRGALVDAVRRQYAGGGARSLTRQLFVLTPGEEEAALERNSITECSGCGRVVAPEDGVCPWCGDSPVGSDYLRWTACVGGVAAALTGLGVALGLFPHPVQSFFFLWAPLIAISWGLRGWRRGEHFLRIASPALESQMRWGALGLVLGLVYFSLRGSSFLLALLPLTGGPLDLWVMRFGACVTLGSVGLLVWRFGFGYLDPRRSVFELVR